MNKGDTVFVIHHSQNVFSGVLGDEVDAGAQGFYTRWGSGHMIYFRTGAISGPESVTTSLYSDENIFCTKDAAKKEIFMRTLRWPRLRNIA